MARTQTYHLVIGGTVQGVGFRPFVYRLAKAYRLTGSVRNDGSEVHIIAQGSGDQLQQFCHDVLNTAALPAKPVLLANHTIAHQALQAFSIVPSRTAATLNVHIPPDYATCPACLAELADPADRRFDYPFINCTACGPRYTIMRGLPYDRAQTSMAGFVLCEDCLREYADPSDRRYHAEPIACPQCGPTLQLQTPAALSDAASVLDAALRLLRNGEILSIKGIGGYHLCCDATQQDAIEKLRDAKPRPDKPLAVMFAQTGADGLDHIRRYLHITPQQAALLHAPSRPIVLLSRRPDASLPDNIAPGLNEVGAMLPYSPLHHLLLNKLNTPIIMTSANLSGEPVLTDAAEVSTRLAHITPHHLHHDRPIQRPADDSVWFENAGKTRPVRLGRGHSPLELALPFTLPAPMLACGGHMKNTVALAWSDRVVVSPHIGDLHAPRSQRVFHQVIDELCTLYKIKPAYLVCDAHPGYASTRWAEQQTTERIAVFHHHAHAACLAGEFPQEQTWLVFTWDGVGYGVDGRLWGGEALFGKPAAWQRVASLREFYLPGGEKAAREPWRSALALVWECAYAWQHAPAQTELLYDAWRKKHNCPASSAVGRLFDAAAALIGLCHTASFEGQAAMYLEHAARSGAGAAVALPVTTDDTMLLRSDWQALLAVLTDTTIAAADRAYIFHATLANTLLEQAETLRARHGDFAVGLCGGVFQNRLLSELVWQKLHAAEFRVYMPEQVPVNDGGLCYGQIIEAAAMLDRAHTAAD